jgi:stage III sporulation protein AB
VLCADASQGKSGTVAAFFLSLARELEKQTEPDVQGCVRKVLTGLPVSASLRYLLGELGQTLGRFDLPGQLRALERSIRETELALRAVREGAPERRRSWQTLGLCIGAALAILFI